jgi:hypothetical protein
MKKQIFTIILLMMGGVSTFGQFKMDGGTNSLRLQTNGVDRMYIAPNGIAAPVLPGNIGIGTITPDSKLHIVNGSAGAVTAFPTSVATLESNTSGYLSILTPATLEGGVVFGSPVNNNNGFLTYWHPLNTMYLGTNSTTRMAIDGTGNVGIGATTPQAKLEVNGDFRLSKITTISVVGTQNALDRLGASVISFNTSGTVTLNGIAGGFEGMIVYLYSGTNNTLILNDENSAATFANQIVTNLGTPITITGRGGVTLLYLGSGWRVIGFAN